MLGQLTCSLKRHAVDGHRQRAETVANDLRWLFRPCFRFRLSPNLTRSKRHERYQRQDDRGNKRSQDPNPNLEPTTMKLQRNILSLSGGTF